MEEERFADKSVQRKQGSEDIDQERNVSTEENTFGNGMVFFYIFQFINISIIFYMFSYLIIWGSI